MRKLALTFSLVILGGCAVPPPGPPNYGSRAYTQPDPNGWQVVSVTPVAPGTGARVAADAASADANSDPGPTQAAPSQVVERTQPVYVQQQPVYVPQPVYVQPPVYAPQPWYAPRPYAYDPYYWWPPISIGLGFSWGHWSGGHGGHGGHGGGHGGWGGHGGGHGGGHRGGH